MKLVALVLLALTGATWAFDRFLARMARKLGSKGQGPPWARRTRERIAKLPFVFEVAMGIGVPVLYATVGPWLLRVDAPDSDAARVLERYQGIALGFSLAVAAALAAYWWARPRHPWPMAVLSGALFAGMIGAMLGGLVAQSVGLGFAGVLPFVTAYVLFRHARAAFGHAQALPIGPKQRGVATGALTVVVASLVGWFLPGPG